MYSDREAFDLFQYYIAVKQHFTTDYDFFKYNGKMRLKESSFETRKDKFFFHKLSKKDEPKNRILANLIVNPKAWIGDIVDKESCNEVYTEWAKRQQQLRYTFKQDLAELDDDFDKEFKVVSGQNPHVINLHLQHRVNLETLVILDDLLLCFRYWENHITDRVLFPNINKSVNKYRPFMMKEGYEFEKFRSILVDKYDDIC